jgi:hypothetical protein
VGAAAVPGHLLTAPGAGTSGPTAPATPAPFHLLARLALAALLLTLPACDPYERAGDTEGEQLAARWEWHGRLVVETDSGLTLTRIRIDSTASARHDVILARFDFDPAYGAGDEYSLTIGLDLGVARDLPLNEPIALGPPPGRIPAAATVTCLCRPLRPDSVRGSLTIHQRGVRQITARIDATLHFTAWHDSTAHVSYLLRQRLYGVK